MSLKDMKKEDLELLNYKDITYLILESRKTTLNTADLFRKIMKLLELPESTFEAKVADYYTSLSTDKRFILLKNGTWDLRNRQTSDKVLKATTEEDEEEDEDEEEIEVEEEDDDSENYDDKEEEYDDDTNEELKDLVIIDEDELELEQ